MSYAYYQGQEAEALAYYKTVLASEANPQVRKELEVLIASLESILAERSKFTSKTPATLHNSALAW